MAQVEGKFVNPFLKPTAEMPPYIKARIEVLETGIRSLSQPITENERAVRGRLILRKDHLEREFELGIPQVTVPGLSSAVVSFSPVANAAASRLAKEVSDIRHRLDTDRGLNDKRRKRLLDTLRLRKRMLSCIEKEWDY